MIRSNKKATAKDQLLRVQADAAAMVASANEGAPVERRVSSRTAKRIVGRSFLHNKGLSFSQRKYLSLRDVSDFISMAQRGTSNYPSARNTDLLPVGNPLSTRKHAMSASAFSYERARWVSSDPRITSLEVKSLVASLLTSNPGSPEYTYYASRISSLPQKDAPLVALIAAFGDGNSRAARSARARLQRRDRKGRFAWMGGGMSTLVRRSTGVVNRLTGRFVAQGVGDDNTFDIEGPDGTLYRVPAGASEASRGVLPSDLAPDGFSPQRANVTEGAEVVNEADLVRIESPQGFRKDESYDGPGTKYTDDAYDVIKFDAGDDSAAEVGATDLIEDLKSDKPVFAVYRRDNPDSILDASQSWADSQATIRADEPNLDKEEGRESEPIARLTDAEFDDLNDDPEFDFDKFFEEQSKDTSDVDSDVENTASKLHDMWREGRKNDDGTYEPRMKDDGEGGEVDIANTDYEDLPEKWQAENRASADHVVNLLRDQEAPADVDPMEWAADEVHKAWIDRNKDWAPDDQMLPYDELTEEEKQKDRDVVQAALDTLGMDSPRQADGEELGEEDSYVAVQDLEDFEFNVPDGAYEPDLSSDYEPRGRTTQESPNYTDDPSILAEMGYSEEDLTDALKQALLGDDPDFPEGSGFGELEFDGGIEDVPAEALYEALYNSGIDPDMAVAKIYDDALGENKNQDALTKAREDFLGVDRDEEQVAEIPEDEGAEKVLPPAIEGASEDERDAYIESGDWTPFLQDNQEFEETGSYNLLDTDPYEPMSDEQRAEADLPDAVFDNPVDLANAVSEEDLTAYLREAIEPDSDMPGMATVSFEDEDGEIVEAYIPGEAIRDALQLQGVNTNELLDGIYSEPREDSGDQEPTDDEATEVIESIGPEEVAEIPDTEAGGDGAGEPPSEAKPSKFYAPDPDGVPDKKMEYNQNYLKYLYESDLEDLTIAELSDLQAMLSQIAPSAKFLVADKEIDVQNELIRRANMDDPDGDVDVSGYSGRRFIGDDPIPSKEGPERRTYMVAGDLGIKSRDLLSYLQDRYDSKIKSPSSKIPQEELDQFFADHNDLYGKDLLDAMNKWRSENESDSKESSEGEPTPPEVDSEDLDTVDVVDGDVPDEEPKPDPVGLPTPTPDNPVGLFVGHPDKLRPGDITFKDDPEREYFVVQSVEKKGSKTIVTGYYPGHESQEKTWGSSTPITFLRGVRDLPESGDKPELSRPFARDYGPVMKDENGNWVPRDEEARAKYLEDKKAFEAAKAESGTTFTPPIDVDSEEVIPLSAPSRPSMPAFMGDDIKALIEEADGDPEKFAELLKGKTVYFIDFETSAQGWDKPTPIQVAVYKYTNGELDGEPFVRFMNPGEPLGDWYEDAREKDPSKLLKDSNGDPISNEFLATQPSKDEVMAELYEYLGENPIIVAHNMAFDGLILKQQSDDLGVDFTPGGMVDTLTLARTVNPKSRNDLKSVASRFGVEDKDWHDAAADADVLPTILYGLLRNMKPWQAEKVFDIDARTSEYNEKSSTYDSDLEAYERFAAERAAAEAVAQGFSGRELDLDSVIEDAKVDTDAPEAESAGPATEGRPGVGTPVDSVAGDRVTSEWVLDDENTEDLGEIASGDIRPGDFFDGKYGVAEVSDVSPHESKEDIVLVTLKNLRTGSERVYSFKKDKSYGKIRRRHSMTAKEEPTPVEDVPSSEEVSVFDEVSTEGWEPFNPVDSNGIRITKGSNPGVFLRDPETGIEYYVKKPKSEEHARNEVLASALYEKAGIPAPVARLGRSPEGELVIVSPLITGGSKDFLERIDDEGILESAREGFALDAWLNNWDVVGAGYDNLLIKDNVVYRIDPGGALLYRARGGDKRSSLTPEVTSIDTMRDASLNPTSASVFGGMSDEDIARSVGYLDNISDDDIDAFAKAAFPDDSSTAEFISSRLKDRKSYLQERYGSTDREEPVSEEREPESVETPREPETEDRTSTSVVDASVPDSEDKDGDVEKALAKALEDPDLADSRDEIEALLGKIKEAKRRAKRPTPEKTEEDKKSEDEAAEAEDIAVEEEVLEEIAESPEEEEVLEVTDDEDDEEDSDAPETPDAILQKLFEEFDAVNNGDGTFTVWSGKDPVSGLTVQLVVQKNKDNTFSVVWREINDDGEVVRSIDSYRSRHSYKALRNQIRRTLNSATVTHDGETRGFKRFLNALARRDKGGTSVGSTATPSVKMTHPSADGITAVSAGDRVYNHKTGKWGTIVKLIQTHRGEGKSSDGDEYKYTDYVLFKPDGEKARRTPSSYMFVADKTTGKIIETGVPVPEVGPAKARVRPERPKSADPIAPRPGDTEMSRDDLPEAEEGKGISDAVRKEIDSIIAGRAESYRWPDPIDGTKLSREEVIAEIRSRVDKARSEGSPMGIDIPLGWTEYDLAEVIKDNFREFGLTFEESSIWTAALRDKRYGKEASERYIERTDPEKAKTVVDSVEFVRTEGRVAIATPLDAAGKILKSGRWKTQFESGASRGAYAPSYRAQHETASLDLHPGIDPRYRPVYGHVRMEEGDLSSYFGAESYGDIVWEMKPEIKERTTMTLGDSLGDPTRHLPMTGEVSEEDILGLGGRSSLYEDSTRPVRDRMIRATDDPYIEVQIMGGVTLDDVETVWMARPRTPERRRFYQDLINAGINVKFYGS